MVLRVSNRTGLPSRSIRGWPSQRSLVSDSFSCPRLVALSLAKLPFPLKPCFRENIQTLSCEGIEGRPFARAGQAEARWLAAIEHLPGAHRPGLVYQSYWNAMNRSVGMPLA